MSALMPILGVMMPFATVVHRVELSPIRLRLILSLSALARTEADAIAIS
jgi:hypothetical protein